MLKKCSYFANSHDWLYLSLFKTLLLTSCGLSVFFHAEEDKKFWENLLTVFDGDFGVLWRYPELRSNAAGPNQVLNCVTFTFFSCSRIRYSARDGGDENDLEIEQAMSMSENNHRPIAIMVDCERWVNCKWWDRNIPGEKHQSGTDAANNITVWF